MSKLILQSPILCTVLLHKTPTGLAEDEHRCAGRTPGAWALLWFFGHLAARCCSASDHLQIFLVDSHGSASGSCCPNPQVLPILFSLHIAAKLDSSHLGKDRGVLIYLLHRRAGCTSEVSSLVKKINLAGKQRKKISHLPVEVDQKTCSNSYLSYIRERQFRHALMLPDSVAYSAVDPKDQLVSCGKTSY